MRKYLMIPLSILAVIFTGCQEQALLVDVNPDGSGTVTVRNFMNMPSGGAMFGGLPGGEDVPAPDMAEQSKKMVEALSQNLGGVELKEGGAVTNAKGWKGYRAVYTFQDINQVIFSSEATITKEGSGGTTSMKTGSNGPAYTFKFTPGSPATLEIIPKADEEDGDKPGDKPGAPAPEVDKAQMAAQQAQMMQMMAPMLEGMRMSGMVRVNGTITDTNAALRTGKNKNVILLFDIQMDKVLKNPKLMKMVQDNPDGPEQTVIEDGLKMQHPKETITVSFQ